MTEHDYKALKYRVDQLWKAYEQAEADFRRLDEAWSNAYQELYAEEKRRAQAKAEKGRA